MKVVRKINIYIFLYLRESGDKICRALVFTFDSVPIERVIQPNSFPYRTQEELNSEGSAQSRMMFFIFQYPDNWSVRWRFLNLKFSTIFYPKCQNNDAVIHFNLSVYIKNLGLIFHPRLYWGHWHNYFGAKVGS